MNDRTVIDFFVNLLKFVSFMNCFIIRFLFNYCYCSLVFVIYLFSVLNFIVHILCQVYMFLRWDK